MRHAGHKAGQIVMVDACSGDMLLARRNAKSHVYDLFQQTSQAGKIACPKISVLKFVHL